MSIRQIKVADIVKDRPVYFVLESDDVAQAARYMTEHDIGAVPVLEKGYEPGVFVDQVGIFSERDLMTRVVAQGRAPDATKVGEVMTEKVVVLDPESNCQEAMAIMEQRHIRHLPVLAGRQLLGTVSMRDLQETQADVREAELRFLDEYFDRMDEAAWGLVPVEQISERVVIQCRDREAVSSESERAPAPG